MVTNKTMVTTARHQINITYTQMTATKAFTSTTSIRIRKNVNYVRDITKLVQFFFGVSNARTTITSIEM